MKQQPHEYTFSKEDIVLFNKEPAHLKLTERIRSNAANRMNRDVEKFILNHHNKDPSILASATSIGGSLWVEITRFGVLIEKKPFPYSNYY